MEPMFPGKSEPDQLNRIFKVSLGNVRESKIMYYIYLFSVLILTTMELLFKQLNAFRANKSALTW